MSDFSFQFNDNRKKSNNTNDINLLTTSSNVNNLSSSDALLNYNKVKYICIFIIPL